MIARAQPAFFSAPALAALTAPRRARGPQHGSHHGSEHVAPFLGAAAAAATAAATTTPWSRGELVGLCAAFGITHDDGVGVSQAEN